MPVESLEVGPLQTNCFLAWVDGRTEALVIDAGGDADYIADVLGQKSLTPVMIYSTHGHADHIAGNFGLRERFGAELPIVTAAAELETTMRPTLNLSYFLGMSFEPPEPTQLVEDNETLEVAGMKFEVRLVPGHTPGQTVLYGEIDNKKVLFAGDTIFAQGIGRTDFPGGDTDGFMKAIKERIMTLPDETIVYAGHGPATTIGEERANNPFVG